MLGNPYRASAKEMSTIAPNHPQQTSPLNARADVLRVHIEARERAGEVEEALKGCEEFLAIFPWDKAVLHARAVLLRRLGRSEQALSGLWVAISRYPREFGLWLEIGTSLLDQGRLAESRSALENALALDDGNGPAWIYLAEVLRKSELLDASEVCFRRGISLSQNEAGPNRRLGQLLARKGPFPDAAAFFTQACRLDPNDWDSRAGLGQVLISMGRFDEAKVELDAVIAAQPDHLDARLGMSRLHLLQGNWAEGWEAYEWRLKRPETETPKLHGPFWNGEDYHGKTVVIFAEQGFGDIIQFSRYIPVLAPLCAKIIFLVPVELVAICKCLESDNVVVQARLSGLPPYDFAIPLLSVPFMMGSGADIPAQVPYLSAPQGRAAKISPAAGTRLKVGIVWAGRPTHANDAFRSVDLETLLPLAGIEGVTLYSLQVGYRSPDLGKYAHPFLMEDASGKLRDYADTAVVIQQMDLMVTVDTSVAHVAGAVGTPIWVLTPFIPDWRWNWEGETTPWYPSMKLYRQTSPYGWEDVMERMVQDLTTWAQSVKPAAGDDAATERARKLFELGLIRQREGKADEALQAYTQSVRLDCRNSDLFNNVGVLMHGQEKMTAAEVCYHRGIALKPDDPGQLSNLGSAMRSQGKIQESLRYHDQAMALAPDKAQPFFNAGHAYRDIGDPEKSFACFDKAAQIEVGNHEAVFDRALAFLQMGRYKDGFAAYESRWNLTRLPKRTIDLPYWDGQPLNGRAIFVQDEQGFGDVIQYARFLPLLKKRGAGLVVLACQPELQRLFELMPDIDVVVGRDAGPTPECEVYAHLLSLPFLLGLDLDSLPNQVPYVQAPPLGYGLPKGKKVNIGMVWAGQTLPKDRSVPLELLLPLTKNPNHRFFSFQLGPRVADLKATGADAFITDLGPRLYDFAETAAALQQMDLLITIDTSAAHLAGALGIPTFLLLLYASDWRWFDRGSTSPWYPSMTLFRQHRPNHWEEAVADLAQALEQFAVAE